MIGLIPWSKSQHKKRGRPYVYSPTVILRCFIVRIWLRLDSNRALHEFLELDYPYNRKVLRVCGLTKLPDRRTFDRRLKTICIDIKERISSMGNLFVKEKLVLFAIYCSYQYIRRPCQVFCKDIRPYE
jgi:hypothetical protein